LLKHFTGKYTTVVVPGLSI